MLANQKQNMSSLCVKHCSKMCVSSFKFELIVEKRVENLPSLIDWKLDSTDRKSQNQIMQNFKIGSKPAKTYRVSIQLIHIEKGNPSYVLKTFGKLVCYSLWDLRGVVPSNQTSIYWNKIYNQALVEPSCCYKDWQLKVIWNLWVGSQSHKRGCLCYSKSKKRRSLWIWSLHVVVSVSYYWN